jgi:hypothetical protein
MISTPLLDAGGTLVMPNFERMAEEYAADGVTVSARALEHAEAEVRLALERRPSRQAVPARRKARRSRRRARRAPSGP